MRCHGIARKSASLEYDIFPEIVHTGHMMCPVYFGHIIGYLHLVLLGFVTLFLLGYFLKVKFLNTESRHTKTGLLLFTGGVMLNEGFLFLQGIAAINSTYIEWINYMLLGAAVIMVSGLATLVWNKQ